MLSFRAMLTAPTAKEDDIMPEAALAFDTPDEEIFYPESDGEPMAETDDHRDEISELVFTLKRHFRSREDVYVSGNLLVYYEEGNPKKRRAPDVFVVLGVPAHQRRTYRLWEESEAPVMAIELTSKGTKSEDEEKKPAVYAKMGIRYLFHYDVLGEYLEPSLQGRRLGPDGGYHRLVGPAKGPFPCPPLGLDLILDENDRLQFVDRETGEVVVRVLLELDQTVEALEQEAEKRQKAEEHARQEVEERQKAEEHARQEAEERQKEAKARRKAEEEKKKAEEEKEKAEQRNREMAAEIERLRAQLGGPEEGTA